MYLLLTSIILLKIVPHMPNAVPIFALLSIFLSYKNSKKAIITVFLIAIIISDLLLALIQNYSLFNSWILFSYTGYVIVILSNNKLIKNHAASLTANTLLGTTIFWIWTNLGTWICSGMYALNMEGLTKCYTLALPFLSSSLIANVVGVLLFVGIVTISKFYRSIMLLQST